MKQAVYILLFVFFVCEVFAIDGNVNKQECIREASVNPALVEKAYNGQVSNVRQLQCYFKCYYENAGYMDAEGHIQPEKLKANIPTGVNKVMANKAIDLCKDRKGKDSCETAYVVQKCLLDNSIQF
ncbi:PREDICTED: general odorant-binding protein 99a-like [Nicrophorus vespilloides]|uniref:General odorant-binding protein 99a-like n=1 Tax=Nicrophorus vespilloides TaxID=110193 RepID=A0ABM1N8A5_NICVS|nr:PREDICTED: general odorant-binding protein 99a-like [Nicrophorus vespilloides]